MNRKNDIYKLLDHSIEEARAQVCEWIKDGCFTFSFTISMGTGEIPTIDYTCYKPSLPKGELND